jgi:hypothetical protein
VGNYLKKKKLSDFFGLEKMVFRLFVRLSVFLAKLDCSPPAMLNLIKRAYWHKIIQKGRRKPTKMPFFKVF